MSRNRHLLLAAVLVAITAAILAFVLSKTNFTPAAASTQAETIDRLLRRLLIMGSAVFALCLVFLIYNIIAFRHRHGDTTDGPPIQHYTPLEIAWTLVPLAAVIFLAIQGAQVLDEINQATPDELEVEVTAFQWTWRFEYPQYDIASVELRLPLDRPVLLKLSSPDVIHSFWVPEFRTKQDAVPGKVTTLRLTPNRLGNYKVQCAELCGVGHSQMQAPVIVVDQTDFAAWVKESQK